MVGGRELGFPKSGTCNLRDQLARTTLNNVRSQGHTYVELREDGKRLVFFCTLCMSPCYSDSVLFDHLKGNLHTERFIAAKSTLLKPNPFPFNDGLHFFHVPTEKGEQSPVCNAERTSLFKLALENLDEEKFAVVCYSENSASASNGHTVLQNALEENTYSLTETEILDVEQDRAVVVPGVLLRDDVSGLAARHSGFGQIAARFYVKDCVSYEKCKIWCEWIGSEVTDDHVIPTIEEHEFAVITFRYSYKLGRKGLLDDLKLSLPPIPHLESEEYTGTEKKKRKTFSDPADVSESLNSRYDSSSDESQFSTNSISRFLIDIHDDQLRNATITSSKRVRKELRRQQRLAAERMCAICQQKMLPGKDVATLLNRTTGRLACSSRNFTGAFHICHVSCLIHWILLCELEPITKQSVAASAKRKSRRKAGGSKRKDTGKNGDANVTGKKRSVFCPECQGTGINIKGAELERPTVNLSEIFKYKIKVIDGQKAWMKNPEVLSNCSTGLYFPPEAEDVNQEYVSPLKVIRFYNAEDYQ